MYVYFFTDMVIKEDGDPRKKKWSEYPQDVLNMDFFHFCTFVWKPISSYTYLYTLHVWIYLPGGWRPYAHARHHAVAGNAGLRMVGGMDGRRLPGCDVGWCRRLASASRRHVAGRGYRYQNKGSVHRKGHRAHISLERRGCMPRGVRKWCRLCGALLSKHTTLVVTFFQAAWS